MRASILLNKCLTVLSGFGPVPLPVFAMFLAGAPLAAQKAPAAPSVGTSPSANVQAALEADSQGPVLSSAEIAQGALLLHFAHADGGLRLVNPGRGAFEVAGANQVWLPAEAHLVNGVVVVSTSLVPQPVMVRYRWKTREAAALFNRADQPAAPFQIDTPIVVQAHQ